MSEAQRLFSVKTIRERCRTLYDLAVDGNLDLLGRYLLQKD